MSLQRRLLLYLLACAPLVWLLAVAVSIHRARHEVNELYDTELIRLARQMQAVLPLGESDLAPPALPPRGGGDVGAAHMDDFSLAVWDAQGHVLLSDMAGAGLPRHHNGPGFVDMKLDGVPWRVYYLQPAGAPWQVAAGQKENERDEIVYELSVSQLVSWLLLLPILLVAMAWAVRRALTPLRVLTRELHERSPDDLRPVPAKRAPADLKPVVTAMNRLFLRIEDTLGRERRFTADAAHELRTPLAVLRAQWDVLRRSTGEAERRQAEAQLGLGLDRLDRLVTQMLSLSRVEAGRTLARTPVHWHTVVEQAVNDCLMLAERRRIELCCEWPPTPEGTPHGVAALHCLPLRGDEHLLTVMLRNLLDNAVRYAPVGTPVTLRLGPGGLSVENEGPALSAEQLARLGERFFRPDGQEEGGSGLGVSIVQRIAALHGLAVRFGTGKGGQGVRVRVQPAPAGPVAPGTPASTQAGAQTGLQKKRRSPPSGATPTRVVSN